MKRALAWFAKVPVGDPVDRSNAFFMQFFFAFYGCMQPLNKLYILAHANLHLLMYSHSHELRGTSIPFFVDLATDAAMSASAWIGFYLIRRGLFKQAVKQFLTVVIVSAVLYFGVTGVVDTRNDSIFFVAMIIAGLMLGRRALWYVYGGTLLAYFTGMTVETLFPPPLPQFLVGLYAGLPGTMFTYAAVAFVLDRSVQSLRKSYDQVNSQHKQLQREIAERELVQEQLLHAQKMDAVGRLASGIAHDIHNVLGVILGFARTRQRLEEPNDDIEPVAQELADALEGTELAARRGAAVCRKLLNFSRRSVTMTETFDVAETLRELLPLLRQLLPPNVHLDVNASDLLLPIHFDRNQFELALLNLVTNARDAMPDGGFCVVSAAKYGENQVEITIRDSGIGMSDETVRRVFEPFFTTKPIGVGTGLGLSVVYDLISRAGGTIAIESTPGLGTCVRIHLPKSEAVAEDALQPSAQSVRVWLIDDDDDLRMLLRAALEQGGCVVEEAANGAQAMRQLTESKLAPAVLICDHRMPDMDGSTLLAHIRERYPSVPAILISSYIEGDNSSGQTGHALNERLPKPFAPETLLAHVHHVARRNALQGKSADLQ
ncbi:hybrid sensor histidine kinase/response regulator [Dyella dinghuensis]|uniref:hybrid sensor histidine kinase/response regulator n=1 Tax=Dyella dinghuensis TaxID=1920169 RepID=UPI001315AE19|nr:ATP-binding protein [Dyella dinghuensis]